MIKEKYTKENEISFHQGKIEFLDRQENTWQEKKNLPLIESI